MSEARSNFLAAASLDRLGHLRRDASWVEQARAGGRYLPVWRRKVMVDESERPRPLFLSSAELADLERVGDEVLLGEHDGMPCFAVALDGETPPRAGGVFGELRVLGELLKPADAALLAYARAMIIWHEGHRHCSGCGGATENCEAGHTRICPTCGSKHFPRVDPAIIVLVADEERCLLGRQPSWPPRRYSTIAGFVEPGESLEDSVRREVFEETGVEVGAIRYHSSQPWPFPSSLMLGFSARPAGGAIVRHDGELEDARWFSRDDIAARQILVPPRVSIAYRLIEQWFDAAPGRSLAAEADPGPWLARPGS